MSEIKPVPIWMAVLPVVILVGLLALNVIIFGDNALLGSNQIVLIFSAAVATALALKKGAIWEQLQKGAVNSIKIATPAILVLLLVGALSGTWMLSGIIPTMIYYGLQGSPT